MIEWASLKHCLEVGRIMIIHSMPRHAIQLTSNSLNFYNLRW